MPLPWGSWRSSAGPTSYKLTPETLARFPDVLTVTKADEDLETVSADLCAVLEEALGAYNEMRAVEGEKLAAGHLPAGWIIIEALHRAGGGTLPGDGGGVPRRS